MQHIIQVITNIYHICTNILIIYVLSAHLYSINADAICLFQDAENLRPLMDDFLDRSLLTDASLLFAPSQIALAGVVYAVNKAQFDCNEYLNVRSLKVID